MILAKKNNWIIKKENESEISISDGLDKCYAFLNKRSNIDLKIMASKGLKPSIFNLSFDRVICPKYIQKIALKIAVKNIKVLTD